MKKRYISLALVAVLLTTAPSFAQIAPIVKPSTPIIKIDANRIQAKMPVYSVLQTGVSEKSAQVLAEVLGLRGNPMNENGLLVYMDAERFQKVPTKPIAEKVGEADEDGQETVSTAIDFAALQQTQVLDGKEALAKAQEALRKAGLSVENATPSIGSSTFTAFSTKGEKVVSADLDTQVNYDFRLNNYKLVGPGAKVKIVFDGEGAVTQLVYAQRTLKQGKSLPIISQATADKLAQTAYQNLGQTGKLRLRSELVYYAPSLELGNVKQILPHYLYSGTLYQGNNQIPLRQIMVPAVADLTPKLELGVRSQGSSIQAKVAVSGGVAPYTYVWSSSTTPLEPKLAQSGNQIKYSLERREKDANLPEVLSVTVTDANGVRVQASQKIDAKNATILPNRTNLVQQKSLGRVDVGTEWIGTSQGLGGSAGNAGGFVKRFQDAGIPVQFNYGDYAAWERDFKDSGLGGDDNNYTDDVDLVFYTGHANGNGFTFASDRDDGFLGYADAAWGQRDLEWIALAACGPLQEMEGGKSLVERWLPAFKGLHILMGYANVSYDNEIEGKLFAKYMLRKPFLWWNKPMKVRQAWAQMATDVQPSSVTYGIMGVWGAGGVSSYNDYFWGKGNVSPDLRGSNISGVWVVRSPS